MSGSTAPSYLYKVPGMSYDYSAIDSGAFARASAAAARDRALREMQAARLMRQASSDAARLSLADQFRQEGDIRSASMLYVRIASSKPPNPSSVAAKERLGDLAQEAKAKLVEIDNRLESLTGGGSVTSAAGPADSRRSGNSALGTSVAEAFREYDELERQYANVYAAKSAIEKRVRDQRRKPEYAAALNEPKAKVLWESGQAREQEKQSCCAYWFYVEGAKLLPAPSAIRARDRLDEMKQDSGTVAAAETCRELQWCHRAYQRAEKLQYAKPDRARELFAEIIERSPDDSSIHSAARLELAKVR
jgi:hypothetical protein